MTTRPGQFALDRLRHHRVKHIAHAIKVVPTHLPPLLLTDHDRTITFDGEVYTPISFGSMSADRREAAFRSGNQEVRGIIDGSTITVPNLDANRYRGAEVRMVAFDWRYPWIVYGRHRKWIRNIVRNGSTFVGTMEGRAQALQRPTGGRFGGTFSTTCTYNLGDPLTCKKDISQWEFVVQVRSVIESRRSFRLGPDNFPATNPSTGATFSDDFYRDGSIEWLYGPEIAGVPWTSITLTTLTDSTQAWTANEHVGDYVLILDAASVVRAHSLIVSNTATVLTFEPIASTSFSVGPYTIVPTSTMMGVVAPIVSHIHTVSGAGSESGRTIELLFPAPQDLAVGDWAIIRPGCDGLLTTCRDKFANQLNHGGDPFAPSASQIIEPVDEPQ